MKPLVRKSNPLREFFIGLSIKGARESVQDLDKVTRKEKELEDQVEKTTEDLGRQSNAFRNIGEGIRRNVPILGRLKSSFAGISTSLKSIGTGRSGVGALATGAKLAGNALMGVLGIAKSIFGYISQTAAVLGGILGAQLINFVGGTTSTVLTKSVQDATAEESAIMELRRALYIQGNYTQALERTLTRTAGRLQDRLGISADDIITGVSRFFLASGQDPRLANRVAIAATRMSDITGKDLGTFFEEISKTFIMGSAGEILTSIVPDLKKLTEEQFRSSMTLDVIEKAIGGFSSFTDRSFGRLVNILSARFSEFLKEFGRPIRDALKTIVNTISLNLSFMTQRGPAFGESSDVIVRLVNTFNSLFSRNSGMIYYFILLDKVMSKLLKNISLIVVDLTKFFADPSGTVFPSLMGKYLEKAGFERSIGGLLEFVFVEFIKISIKAFVRAIGRIFMDIFDIDAEEFKKIKWFNTDFKPIPVPNFFGEDGIFRSAVPTIFKSFPLPWEKMFNAIFEEEEDQKNKDDKKKVAPNPNDQGSISIMQDIKISSNQPRAVIENSLASSMMQISNMGRLV